MDWKKEYLSFGLSEDVSERYAKEAEEQQKMRNTVKVLDPSFPRISILTLKPGEMFVHKHRANENSIYMKLDGMGDGAAAVLLSTGMYYRIDHDALISRVSLVEIGPLI